MRRFQIEAWALRVIERVEAGQPHLARATQQLAGHANATRGEDYRLRAAP